MRSVPGIGTLAWVLVVFVAGTLVFHTRLDLGDVLFTSVPLLVYRMAPGSIAFQSQMRQSGVF